MTADDAIDRSKRITAHGDTPHSSRHPPLTCFSLEQARRARLAVRGFPHALAASSKIKVNFFRSTFVMLFAEYH